MQLSREAIEEYREIYRKEYGEEVSYAEAEEQGTRLIRLFQILLEAHWKEMDEEIRREQSWRPTSLEDYDAAHAEPWI